jgi:hypothetical protein
LTFFACRVSIAFVNHKWIPRSSRWTLEEREQRKIQAQNERGYKKLLYDEKLAFLAEIKSKIILAPDIQTS